MFEVGFTEILVILGLALLVLGPEKLPGLATKIGRWTGRARSMARQLRTQLEQEVTLEELARSKPMQAPQADAATAPRPADPATPEGFDFEGTDASAASAPESEPQSPELDTTPEAMHAAEKNKAHSEPS
jgi:sec-independent protein translocase protein TatB